MRFLNNIKLCLITTEVAEMNRGHLDIAWAGLEAGVDMIQLRDKTMSDSDMISLASKLLTLCRENNTYLIINDRIEVAKEIKADGVHLGQEDRQISEARNILGTEAIIGKSATNFEEAIEAEEEGADYLGVGPIFATPSKDDAAPPMGVAELKRICQAVNKQVLAIGGINIDNLDMVMSAGADGIAIISAVAQSEDMVEEIRRLAIGLMI